MTSDAAFRALVRPAGERCRSPGAAGAGVDRRGWNVPGVIVMGGDCGALGVVRALGRRGIDVRVLSGPNPLAGLSRYATSLPGWPGAASGTAVAWLEERADAEPLKGYLLLPAGDAELRLIAHNHGRLEQCYRLPVPPWKMVAPAADKAQTYARAEVLGIGHPRTWHIAGIEPDLEVQSCSLPLILKPAIKEGVNALTRAKAWRIADRQHLQQRIAEALPLAGKGGLILQELIPDEGTNQYSYCAFAIAGQPRLVMAARRTRQNPRGAGTGTYVETLEPAAFEAEARAFIASLGFTGLIEIEFMLDPRDGRYKLIDANPRVWTWMALGAAAGCDFALAAWQHANGQDVAAARAAPGHAWVHVAHDLWPALADIAGGRLGLGTALGQVAGASCLATWAGDDPLPFLADVPATLWRLLWRAPARHGPATIAS
jgi:predicted ATP-grasp superfamily ATP-dependent carboligase